jgi:putative hemolysin
MDENSKVIDIEKAIRNGKSKFLKSLPRFVIKLIIKIVGQEEINEAVYHNREKDGVPFTNGLMDYWNVKVEIKGAENIPATGRYIFAANHPVGGMDGLAMHNMIYRYFPKIVSPANELLAIIPNIRSLMLGLNVYSKNSRELAIKLQEVFESDVQMIFFPAGEVSRRKRGKISDVTWQKTFISKAIQHKRDIIPVFVSGRNSGLFYTVANLRKFLGIKMYIESMLLPREMLRQKNTTTTVYVGKPIPYQTFTGEMTHAEWAARVKEIVYSLPLGKQ